MSLVLLAPKLASMMGPRSRCLLPGPLQADGVAGRQAADAEREEPLLSDEATICSVEHVMGMDGVLAHSEHAEVNSEVDGQLIQWNST